MAAHLADRLPEVRQLWQRLAAIDLPQRWQAAAESEPEDDSQPHASPPVEGPIFNSSDLPDRPCWEDYCARYPQLGELADLPTELVLIEYEARWLWGDRPAISEYLKRFPQGQPELAQFLERKRAQICAAVEAEIDAELQERPDRASLAGEKVLPEEPRGRPATVTAKGPLVDTARGRRRRQRLRRLGVVATAFVAGFATACAWIGLPRDNVLAPDNGASVSVSDRLSVSPALLQDPLALAVRIRRDHRVFVAHRLASLEPFPLRRGDQLEVRLRTSRPRYLCVYWYDTSGKPNRLLPVDPVNQRTLAEADVAVPGSPAGGEGIGYQSIVAAAGDESFPVRDLELLDQARLGLTATRGADFFCRTSSGSFLHGEVPIVLRQLLSSSAVLRILDRSKADVQGVCFQRG